MNSKTYKEALAKKYKAAMFDIDGTLTEIGKGEIPEPLARKLAELSLEVPLAFATGRSLESFLPKLEQILKYSPDPEKSRINWHGIGENGALGYFYDPKTQDYKEFYRIEWPDDVINREELREKLVKRLGNLLHSTDLRVTQLLLRPRWDEGDTVEDNIEPRTAEIKKIAEEVIAEYEGADQFDILDSSIAVHLSPKHANKDKGIIEFAKHLGIELPAREILIIGDQAGEGRNDHELLRGEYGTPFTAGDLN